MKRYFTFGQAHRHEVNGVVFDKDCVAEIEAECPRDVALELFGTKWCWEHEEHSLKKIMEFFPRGIIKVS